MDSSCWSRGGVMMRSKRVALKVSRRGHDGVHVVSRPRVGVGITHRKVERGEGRSAGARAGK